MRAGVDAGRGRTRRPGSTCPACVRGGVRGSAAAAHKTVWSLPHARPCEYVPRGFAALRLVRASAARDSDERVSALLQGGAQWNVASARTWTTSVQLLRVCSFVQLASGGNRGGSHALELNAGGIRYYGVRSLGRGASAL